MFLFNNNNNIFDKIKQMEKIELSLILACFNEEPHLEENFKKILWILKHLKVPFEIIFVEDCSSDKTKKIINHIVNTFKKEKITALFHKQNIGRGGSVSDGFRRASGQVVGFLDVDLEISENFIPVFYWKIKEGKDVAIAKREYEFTMQKLIRFIATKMYAYLVRFLLKSPFNDTEAGYKFFNRDKILPILSRVKDKKWFWDTEIIMRSHHSGLSIIEIPVVFVRNPNKKSTVRIIPDSIEYLKKLLKFSKETYESN